MEVVIAGIVTRPGNFVIGHHAAVSGHHQRALHAGVGMAGDLAQHRILTFGERAEIQFGGGARLQVGDALAGDGQVVHHRVGVRDSQDDRPGGRHQVCRIQCERTELEVEHRCRFRRAADRAGRARVAVSAPTECEEPEHQCAQCHQHRDPVEERAVTRCVRRLRGRRFGSHEGQCRARPTPSRRVEWST